jgi:large subunit ribosomal protein L29
MKFTEVKDMTVDELRKKEVSLRSDLTELKLKHAMGQMANPLTIRLQRRDLARVKTALASKLK